MKPLPSIQELADLMDKVQKGNKKLKRKVIEAAAQSCPQFGNLHRKNPKFGDQWPDEETTLGALAYRAIETHPQLYRQIRSRQIESSIGIGTQFDSACLYNIPITRIDPDLFDMMLECEPPIDTQLLQEGTTPRFPTEYFVIPKGKLTIENKQIILIGVTCLTPELNIELKTGILSKITGKPENPLPLKDGLIFISALTDSIEEYYSYHPLIDGVIQKQEKFRDHTQMGVTADEKEFVEKLLSIGIQIILLHNYHPEWSVPEKEKPEHSGSGRITRTYHPRILGGLFPHKNLNLGDKKSPKPDVDAEDPSRKRPCEHWKGWHWKTVLYGTGRSLRKRKLIMPYRVNEGIE
jgi:hypothetical protein